MPINSLFPSCQRSQLINMNTIADFMYCATDEGPGPAIRYQYPEFHKLYATVSLLVRSCELPARIRELDNNNSQTVPVTEINPYALRCDNYPPFVLPPNAAEFLFEKSSYVKKLLEDQTAVVMEENLILLKV